MVSTKIYKSSRTYDAFMKLLGYENSIDRFLRGLTVDVRPDARILDAGCGTGLLGLHFLERVPQSTLVATDLEPNFLKATLLNAKRRHIDTSRITVGIADISDPIRVVSMSGDRLSLDECSFDLICVGAVIGYSRDVPYTIRTLLKLLAPNGYLLNLEMNESPTGKFVSRRYDYRNIDLGQMHEMIRREGCEVRTVKFGLRHLPAKFTRAAIVARKTVS